MATESSYVYVWTFDESTAHVFWGDDEEPERQWERRTAVDCELSDWLRTLDKQPKLAPRSILWPMYGNRARTVVRQLSKQLVRENFTLLASRDRATVVAGYQKRRPLYVVVQGKRRWFSSVSRAAFALGLDKSTVTLNCQNPNRTDFQYDEPGAK